MFKTLQMGRALAALGVCAFHLSLAFNDPRFGNSALFLNVTQFGRLGVEFFFSLSGFIIMYAHWRDADRPHQLPRFFVKRFVRIYPLYWMLTAIALIALIEKNQIKLSMSGVASVLSLIRLTNTPTPLAPAWSLFHEIFFYGVFSLIIISRRIGLIGFGLWLLGIVWAGMSWQFAPNTLFNTAFLPINICFFGGMGAYFAYDKLSPRIAGAFFAGGLLAVFGAFLLLDEITQPISFSAMMSLAFFGIISGAVRLEKQGFIKNIPLLTLIGNSSYALYLVHGLLITALLKLSYSFDLEARIGSAALFFGIILTMAFSSLIMHLRIEKPMTSYLNSRFGQPRRALNRQEHKE